MFTNAFGNAGAERRIGIGAAWAPRRTSTSPPASSVTMRSISRGSGAAPGESWGVNGRATWEPVLDTGKIIHVGISGYYRERLKSGDTPDAVRLSDRPNIRIDGGNIADSGRDHLFTRCDMVGRSRRLACSAATNHRRRGRRLWLDRFGGDNQHFTGYYGYAAYMLDRPEHADSRAAISIDIPAFKDVGNGGLWRLRSRPRYDHLNLRTRLSWRAPETRPRASRGAELVFNPYAKLMFNWIRSWGDNTPLDPVGSKTKGDAFATRLHLDF